MTTNEVQNLIRQNIALYKVSEKALSEKDAAIQIAVWASALQDVPAPAGFAAMQKAFAVCRFPVTLADLMNQLRAMQAEHSETSAECWARLLSTARKAEQNADCYRFTAHLPDGRTQGQAAKAKNQALFDDLHPAARRWLGSLQELVELGRMDDVGLRIRRTSFEKSFSEYQVNAPLNPRFLNASLPEAANVERAKMSSERSMCSGKAEILKIEGTNV